MAAFLMTMESFMKTHMCIYSEHAFTIGNVCGIMCFTEIDRKVAVSSYNRQAKNFCMTPTKTHTSPS